MFVFPLESGPPDYIGYFKKCYILYKIRAPSYLGYFKKHLSPTKSRPPSYIGYFKKRLCSLQNQGPQVIESRPPSYLVISRNACVPYKIRAPRIHSLFQETPLQNYDPKGAQDVS